MTCRVCKLRLYATRTQARSPIKVCRHSRAPRHRSSMSWFSRTGRGTARCRRSAGPSAADERGQGRWQALLRFLGRRSMAARPGRTRLGTNPGLRKPIGIPDAQIARGAQYLGRRHRGREARMVAVGPRGVGEGGRVARCLDPRESVAGIGREQPCQVLWLGQRGTVRQRTAQVLAQTRADLTGAGIYRRTCPSAGRAGICVLQGFLPAPDPRWSRPRS